MLGFLLLFPMVLLSTAMSVFVAMLVAFSAVMTLAMGVFVGALVTYAAAFMIFMMIMFS